jgi:hypothetical protein
MMKTRANAACADKNASAAVSSVLAQAVENFA